MSDNPAPEKKTAEERQTERLNALPWQPWRPGDLAMPSFTSPLEPLFQEGEEEQDDGQPKVQVDQNELQNLQRRAEQQGFQQGLEAGQKQGKPQLRVNPADFERVETQMGASLSMHGWRLLADNQIHSGGCKVSAEDGDMDASIATRWHELCRLAAPGDL